MLGICCHRVPALVAALDGYHLCSIEASCHVGVGGRWQQQRRTRATIAPASSYLLVEPIDCLGQTGVDDAADVCLTDSKAECGCRHDNVNLARGSVSAPS